MQGKEHTEQRQELRGVSEKASKQPGHCCQSNRGAPKVGVVFSAETKPQRAPTDRVRDEGTPEDERETFSRRRQTDETTQCQTSEADVDRGGRRIQASVSWNQAERPDCVSQHADQ